MARLEQDSPQVAEQQSAGGPTDAQVIAALVLIVLARPEPDVAVDYIAPIVTPLGVGVDAVKSAVALLWPHLEPAELAAGPAPSAIAHAARTAPARSGAYLLNAARRLAKDRDVAAERRYLEQHLNARRARRDAARNVDVQARAHGPLLGWYSLDDERTTAECREADGKNFMVGRPSALGYPGMPHGGTCRCRAGAPHAGAELMQAAS